MTPPGETSAEKPAKAKKARPERYGFGRVYQRGAAWWIAWYANGMTRRESVARLLGKPMAAVTERDAIRLLNVRLQDKARGKVVLPQHERATVAEMLADYERHLEAEKPDTVDGYRSQIRATAGWLGKERVQALDLVRLTDAARAREDAGWLRGTVKQRLGVLHAAMVYWQRAGRLATVPPMPRLTVHNTRHGFFEDTEVAAITRHMPEEAADITWALYYLGWRINEVLGLTWDRIDLRERTVRLDTSKNKEGRTRPIIEEGFLALLERRRRARVLGAPYVFWRALLGEGRGAKVSETWFREQWKAAAIAAGLEDKIPHDFRRTAYRNLVMAGVDLATAMALTGHRSLSVALRYNIADLARQRAGLERLEAHRKTLAARSGRDGTGT